MDHNYEFEYGRLMLKPLREEDIEEARLLRNKNSKFYFIQDDITEEQQKKWYLNYLKKDNEIMFKVVKKDNPKEFIGTVGLYYIDFEKGVAEEGRSGIDKEKAPEKGIGTEAIKAVCKFGFDVLKLKKIVAETKTTNTRINKVNEKVGYTIVKEKDGVYYKELTPETLNA